MSNHPDSHCPACSRIVTSGIAYRNALWHEDCVARALVDDAWLPSTPRPLEPNGASSEENLAPTASCLEMILSLFGDIIVPLLLSLLLGGAAGGVAGSLLLHIMTDASWLPLDLLFIGIGVVVGSWLALQGSITVLSDLWVVHQGAFVLALVARVPMLFGCQRPQQQVRHIRQRRAPDDTLPPWLERVGMVFEALELPLIFVGGIISGGFTGFLVGGVLGVLLRPGTEEMLAHAWGMGIALGGLFGAWSAVRLRFTRW